MGERTDLTRRMESVSVSDYDYRDPEEIRNEIKKTRANISQTIDTLQDRLDPERLKDEARTVVRDATIGRLEDMANNVGRKARRVRYSVMDTIKENPIPAALVGLGLGWLLVEGFNQSSREEQYWTERRYYPTGEGVYSGSMYEVDSYEAGDEYRARSRVRETFDEARDKTGQVVDRARERAEELGQQAKDQAAELGYRAKSQAQQLGSEVRSQAQQLGSEVRGQVEHLSGEVQEQIDYLGDQARHQARRARGQFDTMLEENPLAVGAAALALGVVVGLSVPETSYENRMMGPMRDNLMDKAQEVAEDTMQKVERVAEEAGRTIQDEASRQNLTPSSF
jgi:ElaB/YqjD/DUF883 family membrane-anchored ribosome-binding protein